jgi:hypothetical protein
MRLDVLIVMDVMWLVKRPIISLWESTEEEWWTHNDGIQGKENPSLLPACTL